MAAGRPVVVALEGPARQVVESVQAGIAVAPGDPAALAAAVQELASDREAARQMGRRGREYVTVHFARPDMARLLEQTLISVSGG
jgi:glycosyltransferase involved in cell wall biosynthesis